ncbi:hypothetical protein CENSYa_1190 [Cenarchaeum symbiosum A]|uniref:Uncharacterized protein n=1 Tax=Cenarchaeum symbiosum (strain A) TaxID=414004 RepID=A0RWU5_CENSY|nr:hypothetical protein CENSYa_1188 [Cenarchaeum symbiosum A]ABK77814.1 hypothetical protein CENSYa_1190 [Cenarchaeum symbiosum A]
MNMCNCSHGNLQFLDSYLGSSLNIRNVLAELLDFYGHAFFCHSIEHGTYNVCALFIYKT